MNINDILKRQTIIITVTIIGICLTLVGVSYALFFNVKEGTTQIVESGDLVIQFSNGTLLDSEMIPIPDSEGENSNGYTFSVTNKGTLPMRYEIYIYDKEGIEGETRLPHQYIKVKLDNEPIKRLSELPTKDNKLLLKDNLDVKAKGTGNGEDVRTHTIRIWIDEEAPEEIVGNIIALDIEVKGVVGEKLPLLSEIIVADNKEIFDDETEDHNLRYVGKDPNNYIYFNCDNYEGITKDNAESEKHCEKWRIIGLMNNMVKENGNKESLVKIVRAEKIGDYSWDNKNTESGATDINGKNDWSTAELMYLLNPNNSDHKLNGTLANNSLYWNHDSGKCSTDKDTVLSDCDFRITGLKGEDSSLTKSMIESVVWNLGTAGYIQEGYPYHNDMSTAKAIDYYNYERSTETLPGYPTTWIGEIGLIYPSDYGFATSGDNAGTNRESCLNKELLNWTSICGSNDWLKPDVSISGNWSWAMTPSTPWKENAIYIYSSSIVNGGVTGMAHSVFPSLYLKSNVVIIGGKGTSEEPYIIK